MKRMFLDYNLKRYKLNKDYNTVYLRYYKVKTHILKRKGNIHKYKV